MDEEAWKSPEDIEPDEEPVDAWRRFERVLGRVVARCGAGLAETPSPQLAQVVGEDDLIASMLVMHGVHPAPIEERIEQALAALRAEHGLPASALALGEVCLGIARVTLDPSDPRPSETMIRRAITAVAPEIIAVDIRTRPHA